MYYETAVQAAKQKREGKKVERGRSPLPFLEIGKYYPDFMKKFPDRIHISCKLLIPTAVFIVSRRKTF